jgi:hypothetical protein
LSGKTKHSPHDFWVKRQNNLRKSIPLCIFAEENKKPE